MTTHTIHQEHTHAHSANCGHKAVKHEGHTDYLHNGHLHFPHEKHYDDHVIAVNEHNPATCSPIECACNHIGCGHEQVPHGDHMDYLYNGQLHFKHGDHCDQHGSLA
ncbi:MAG TPA: hypothetical protein VGN34_22065 [Ktedonobacteraceae bacterium]|jgi:hypothetical protein